MARTSRGGPRGETRPTRARGVELAAAAIPRIERKESLETTLKIGKIVYECIFEGDSDAAYRGRKDSSFRKLAQHPAVTLSTTALWRACGTYQLSLHWPALLQARHITPSHVRAVLGLPPREQRRLLVRAEKERWPSAKLEARAVPLRHAGGRPRKAKVVRALDSVQALLDDLPEAVRDSEGIRALDDSEVAAGLKATNALRERLSRLESVLRRTRR